MPSLALDLAAALARAEKAEAELTAQRARRFPLMDGPSIPWSLLAPHEGQAQRNHHQSLRA